MSKQVFFCLSIIYFVFSSCKNEKPKQDQEVTEPNFLINEKNPKKAYQDYTLNSASDTVNILQDDNLAVKVRVGEEVVFKDASEPSNAISDRQWEFTNDLEPEGTDQVAKFTFQSPGLYEVKLSVNGKYNVSKMILALGAGDENIISVNQVASIENLQNQSHTSSNVSVEPPKANEQAKPEKKTQQTPPSPSNPFTSVNESKTASKTAETKKTTPPPTSPTASVDVKSHQAGSNAASKPATTNPIVSTPPPPKLEMPKPPPPVVAPPKKEENKPSPPVSSTPPPVVAKEPSKPAEAETKFKNKEKTGANSKFRGEEESKWIEKSSVTLTPKTKCKISELSLYCNSSGKVKLTLRNNQSGQSNSMTSNVIKGKSQIILEDFDDIILEPGNSYTLSADAESSTKIEDVPGATILESHKLKFENKGSVSFFDIIFRY